MTSPGLIFVDETVEPYRKLRVPKNWRIHFSPQWGSLQASMSYVFEKYPDATHYGWLADDTVPRTKHWDRKLEEAAGDWCLSYANDDWLVHDPIRLWELEEGENLSAGLCWGGRLVREVGWWALPGVRQAGIDTAWTAIVGPLDLARYVNDVVVEHKHYRTGKRVKDQGDEWSRGDDPYVERDIQVRDRWAGSSVYRDLLARVSVAAGQPMTDRRRARLVNAWKDSAANEAWFAGVPAARLVNARAAAEVPVEVLYPDSHSRPA